MTTLKDYLNDMANDMVNALDQNVETDHGELIEEKVEEYTDKIGTLIDEVIARLERIKEG